MAKRVIWTNTAKKARRAILEYWITHNRSKTYSKKLSVSLKEKIYLIASQNYIGKPTHKLRQRTGYFDFPLYYIL